MKKTLLLLLDAAVVGLIVFSYGCSSNLPRSSSGRIETEPKITSEGVLFSLYAPRAKRINIAGDFNNWSKSADPLSDRDGDGVWQVTIPLKPGRYQYKFVIDGKRWVTDPENPNTVDDGFGGKNSIVIVK